VTGSERQGPLINHIATKWREYGFDDVEIPEYQVLLSLPQEDQPNTVEILSNRVVEYSIIGKINVRHGPIKTEACNFYSIKPMSRRFYRADSLWISFPAK